jgi:hypothetical protein
METPHLGPDVGPAEQDVPSFGSISSDPAAPTPVVDGAGADSGQVSEFLAGEEEEAGLVGGDTDHMSSITITEGVGHVWV